MSKTSPRRHVVCRGNPANDAAILQRAIQLRPDSVQMLAVLEHIEKGYSEPIDVSYFQYCSCCMDPMDKRRIINLLMFVAHAYTVQDEDGVCIGGNPFHWVTYCGENGSDAHYGIYMEPVIPSKPMKEKAYLYDAAKLDALLDKLGNVGDIVRSVASQFNMNHDSPKGWTVYAGRKDTFYSFVSSHLGQDICLTIRKEDPEAAVMKIASQLTALNAGFKMLHDKELPITEALKEIVYDHRPNA